MKLAIIVEKIKISESYCEVIETYYCYCYPHRRVDTIVAVVFNRALVEDWFQKLFMVKKCLV